MPTPAELFRFCPRCGATASDSVGTIPFRCSACDLMLFFNPTVAAGAFIHDAEDRALFIVRDREPAKGKLAIPGGFIDFGESAEEALRREVREEVGLEIEEVQFLVSCPNRYDYRGVVYPVCDLIFTAQAIAPESAQSLDGVAEYQWRSLAQVNADDLAFPSIRRGWEILTGRTPESRT